MRCSAPAEYLRFKTKQDQWRTSLMIFYATYLFVYRRNTLGQPSVIKSHLDRSTHNSDDETVMVFEGPFFFDNKKSMTPLPYRSPKFPPSEKTPCHVNGSVNGLICFSSYCTSTGNHVIHIWNPSLSALLHLPPSAIRSSNFSVLFRFGYDPKADDYKVVKLCYMEELVRIQIWIHARIFHFQKCLQLAEVYSMRKGYWESITQKFPSHVSRIYDHSEICEDGHDGYVHWLGDDEKKLQTIVAFDLGSETFNEISLPHSIQDYSKNYSCLGYMYGKLCVMSRNKDFDCQVWIMDEYGVAESWVKHHIFPQHCGILRPFGFILNNVFLFETHNHYLGLYDLNAAEAESIDIKVSSVRYASTKIVRYVDSLVWVAPTKRGN